VRSSPLGGRWRAIYGPARIPSTLPPTRADGRLVAPPGAGGEDEERRYCADLQRRILEFETDPVNFFKVGGKRV
jgi:hypothetical protein